MMDTNQSQNQNQSNSDKLNQYTAEVLLKGSPYLTPVLRLRDVLSRESDGTLVNYDDMFLRLRDEVKSLPTLELQSSVPAGSESAYQRQLLHALEKINDDHDRVLHKVVKMKSRLLNAVHLMKIQRSQFTAFYHVAMHIVYPNVKFSAIHIKDMASGEYSRIMDNLDNSALSWLSELDILEAEVKGHKSAQTAKYQLGKDQVNLMWNSIQINGAIGLDDDPNTLLKKNEIIEDEDEIPSFVSRRTKEIRVASSSSYVKPSESICSICGEKQISTPSGFSCINGHTGGESVEDHIKGTFLKLGDPKPATLVIDEEGKPCMVELSTGEGLFTLPERKDIPESPVEVKTGEWSSSRLLELEKEEEDKIELENTEAPVTKSILIEDIEDNEIHSMKEEVAIEKGIGNDLELPNRAKMVENIEDFLNSPEPLATPAPINPRKKLVLLDEDEL